MFKFNQKQIQELKGFAETTGSQFDAMACANNNSEILQVLIGRKELGRILDIPITNSNYDEFDNYISDNEVYARCKKYIESAIFEVATFDYLYCYLCFLLGNNRFNPINTPRHRWYYFINWYGCRCVYLNF